MLTFYYDKAEGRMTVEETLTSGMVGAKAKLEFSADWDDLVKTAVFYAGTAVRTVVNVQSVVTIPAEVLSSPMQQLYVGVYGISQDGSIALPTIRACGPMVRHGADPDADPAAEVTPTALEQLLARIGPMDELETEAQDSLVAAINEIVALAGGDIDQEALAAALAEYLAENPIAETDPTVPAWAKAEKKPTYTADEVGALPDTTAIPVVPTQVSAFENDAGYLTEHQDLSSYAKAEDIPTKVSQLDNDSGYLTEHQSLEGYAKTTDIPTAVSALTNDSGYQTAAEVTAIVQEQLGVIENGTY